MSKPTMGRGLGALMSETKPQGDNQNSNGQPQIAAGVRTLMQGAKSTTATATAPAPAAPVTSVASTPATRVATTTFDASAGKPKPFVSSKVAAPSKTAAPQITDPKGPAIPRWCFLAADAVLIVLALFVALKSPKPMPTSRMIVSIAIVVLAAGCGMCAVLARSEKE